MSFHNNDDEGWVILITALFASMVFILVFGGGFTVGVFW